MRKFTKLFTTKATSINDETKTIRFKISDNQADRMGEIVDQETWDFKNYMNNPIVLWGHNPDEPENVLGQTLALETQSGETFAEMSFDDDINPKASLVWKQILKGTLRTVSVGFISHDIDGNTLKNNELLEISVVPIPANPRAFALSYKAGEITKKDAKYLIDSMKTEVETLEKQLDAEDTGELKEKDVEELQAQMTQMIELLGKQGEEMTAMRERLEAIETAKADETTDDTTEDDKTPENGSDESTDDNEEEDTSAKGGDTDQSGAETDDIDLDAELTPELEAQLETQLATDDQAA